MTIHERLSDGPYPPAELCWPATAFGCRSRSSKYAQLRVRGRKMLAHRAMLEIHHVPLPLAGSGLEVDHWCRNPVCVNPLHLRVVTPQQNCANRVFSEDVLRERAMRQLRKTHCPRGHPYAGANLYINPKGGRVCRSCASARSRAARAKEDK